MSLSLASLEQLGQRLADSDHNARIVALAELIRRGRAAVPALLKAFAHTDTDVRVFAAEGLGEVADPAQADLYRQMLDDNDGSIRARGAQGLARIDDPAAIEALVRTIDDLPDLEHFPQTLSTYSLIHYGAAALPVVAPLLSDARRVNRERAFFVVLLIIEQLRGATETNECMREFGDPRVPGRAGDEAAAQWQSWIMREYP